MEENVKNQLDQLGNIIDAKLEKAHGQALDSVLLVRQMWL